MDVGQSWKIDMPLSAWSGSNEKKSLAPPLCDRPRRSPHRKEQRSSHDYGIICTCAHSKRSKAEFHAPGPSNAMSCFFSSLTSSSSSNKDPGTSPEETSSRDAPISGSGKWERVQGRPERAPGSRSGARSIQYCQESSTTHGFGRYEGSCVLGDVTDGLTREAPKKGDWRLDRRSIPCAARATRASRQRDEGV